MVNVWSVSKVLEDTGVLSKEECIKATPFCVSACEEISKRLKDIKFEDNPCVILACAGIALYNYVLVCSVSAEEFSSFKAGDVTVKQSSSSKIESAAKFRDEAVLGAVSFLSDVDFIFGAVDV